MYTNFRTVFEGEGEVKTFTQDEVNAIVAKEKNQLKAKYDTQIASLEKIKESSQLTVAEKAELQKQIESLQAESMTKEELAKQDKAKSEKKYKEELDKTIQDRDSWKSRYTKSTIERSIIDAAIAAKAYDPEQIIALLAPKTELLPDGDGFKIITSFDSKGEDGKIINLKLSPSEVVTKMVEIDKYSNLFQDGKKSGLGGTNSGGSSKLDVNKLKDTKAYLAARKGKK